MHHEHLPDSIDRTRLRSPHSAAALAINTFLPWQRAPDQLPLAGWTGFDAVQFEVRCPTGLRGTPPHLDFVALRGEVAVAVTVRCTEYLSRRRTAVAPSYDRLLAATPGLDPWRWQLERLRHEPNRHRHLDLGALVKFALALGRTFPERPTTLLYLYWEPINAEEFDEFCHHRQEAAELAAAVREARVAFDAQSFDAIWRQWAEPPRRRRGSRTMSTGCARATASRSPPESPCDVRRYRPRVPRLEVPIHGRATVTTTTSSSCARRRSASRKCSRRCLVCWFTPSSARPRSPSIWPAIDPAAVTSLAALAALPVLRKSDLSERQQAEPPFGGLTATPIAQFAKLFMSPGPILEPEGTRPDYWRFGRALYAAGFRPGDVVHNAFAYHLTPAGSMIESGARALGCPVIPAGTGQTELQLTAIARVRPTAYAGTPSFLKILLERGRADGIDVSCFTKALVGGEAFPKALAESFEREFGVHAYQCYGTADLGLIAYETPAREGLVIDEGVLVEIVRPGTGDPVPVGRGRRSGGHRVQPRLPVDPLRDG